MTMEKTIAENDDRGEGTAGATIIMATNLQVIRDGITIEKSHEDRVHPKPAQNRASTPGVTILTIQSKKNHPRWEVKI